MITGLHAARLFDGDDFADDRVLLLEGPRIAAIVAPAAVPADATIRRLPADAVLAPGFIDLQVNGGGGIMFNDHTDPDGLRRIADAHARTGTTAILPTLISDTRAKMRAAIAAAAAAMAQPVPGIVGLHLEGPFLSPARRGIHPPSAITAITEADIAMLAAPFPGRMLLTLAPECAPAGAIARLVQAGVIVFAGHTDASFEQAIAGLDSGVSGFTHLFNAMSQLEPRGPGVIGAALHRAASHAGIIVDGHHVHPTNVAIAFAAKGRHALFLVSDAMATAGSDATGFMVGDEPIRLVDGRLTSAAGTLAGAHLTMAEAVRNAVAMAAIPLADALHMATAGPADILGLADRGRLAPGSLADLVLLDARHHVTAVWQGGRELG